jgi:hypothetical protein
MSTKSNAVSTRSGGVTGRGFMPGQSGNPAARAALGPDGHDVIAFFVAVMEGDKKTLGERRPIVLRDRIEAAKWLAERGYGKPESVDVATLQAQHDEEQAAAMREAAAELPAHIRDAIRAWLMARHQKWIAEQMLESEAKMKSYMPPDDNADDSETDEATQS